MAYTINANAKNVWIRDNEDTRDLSIQTDASSVYLDNGRTLEQELGEGSMVSNVATVDTSMSKVIDGTLDGVYESGVMYGRSLVNLVGLDDIDVTGSGQNSIVIDENSVTMTSKVEGSAVLLLNIMQKMKANTKYLLKCKHSKNKSVGISFGCQWSGADYRHLITNMNDDFMGVFTTGDELPLRLYIGYLGSSDAGTTVTCSDIQIIEYQEGMENWDIPYFEGLCDVKMPILHNVGKNLFDGILESGRINVTTGENQTNSNMVRSRNFVEVKPSTTYTLSYEIDNGLINVAFYGSNKEFLGINLTESSQVIGGSLGSYKKILTTNNTHYLRFYSNSALTITDTSFKSQLEESPTPTPYEDYKTNILHTPETVTLRSLPNGVRDELNLKTGEYIKRIGEVTLDGSENWKAWESNDTHCKLSLANYPPNMRINGQHTTRLVCDKLKIGNDRVGVVNDNFMASVGDVAYTIIVGLELGKLTSADVAGFKQWLKENPLTVQYELAEPITTKVTLTQSEPIVKIGTELPNGVCDTYNLLTGEHIQRVGKVVLDGSEVWKNTSLTSHDGQYYISYCPLSSMKKYTIASGVISLTSDKFIAEPPVGDEESKRLNREFIASYGSNATVVDGESNWIYLSVEKRKIASNTGIAFADYLKSNPVTVWYELKTPIVTKKNGLPNTYGITLPNGVADKYNESTGVYTQNIGKVVLNGTENWILGLPETTNNITFAHDITWGKVGHCVSSDRFETQYISSTNSTPIEDKESILCGNRFSSVAGRINITIAKSKLSAPTIEGFRQWLSQNPTTVYHELATPVEVPIYRINVGKTLPNGVCDTYNPVTKEYIQNIKKMVLNGDDSVTYLWETFSNPAENTVAISITNLSDVVNGSGQITSDKIPFGTSSMDDVESILYNHDNRKITIEILKSRLTELNLAGFKKWLQKNPLTVWYQLATPVISKVDINMETLYVGHPIVYENGHVILESGHDGQSLLPTLEYSTVTNRVKQIESIGEQVLRQEKQLTMLEQMLIQNIIGLDYNNTVLALNLEINEVM